MKRAIYVCRFDAAEHLRGKARTYDAVRAAVVEAGGFSIFEATASPNNVRIFTRIERDPAVIVRRDLGYPWIVPVTWAPRRRKVR